MFNDLQKGGKDIWDREEPDSEYRQLQAVAMKHKTVEILFLQ